METQSLYGLVERIAGKGNVSLIAPALQSYEVQSEQKLTEVTATVGTHRAIDYIEKKLSVLSAGNTSLCLRRQLISEHLLGR
jgi:hypothetical protein